MAKNLNRKKNKQTKIMKKIVVSAGHKKLQPARRDASRHYRATGNSTGRPEFKVGTPLKN